MMHGRLLSFQKSGVVEMYEFEEADGEAEEIR